MRKIDADELIKTIEKVCFSPEWARFRADFGSNGERDYIINEIVNAPTIEEKTGEWIPITKRPMTDDEWEELSDEAKDYIDEDGKWFFDCPMPEDGQNILISTKWGVWGDTCEISAEGGLNAYYLEENGDWDGVLAWMPMPEPYKEGEE